MINRVFTLAVIIFSFIALSYYWGYLDPNTPSREVTVFDNNTVIDASHYEENETRLSASDPRIKDYKSAQ